MGEESGITMATVFEALPFVGALLGVIAALYSLALVWLRRRAEAKLQYKLALDEAYREFVRARNVLAHAEEHAMSEEEIDELLDFIRKELSTLEEGDRERIEEALYQPSVKGRSNYLYKLVTSSGRALE